MKKSFFAAALTAALLVSMVSSSAFAADGITTVNGDGQAGWTFAADPANATPYEFNLGNASIGEGSLYVAPISATPAHKFIARLSLNAPVASVSSIAYDFLIAGNGDAISDANEFYLNVYTNLPESTTFYDCRFDYSPSSGSTALFTPATFATSDATSGFGDRDNDGFTCPATLAAMPAGSTISAFTLNVGDTGASDEGLAGYLDNVVVTTTSGTTRYDFEPTADACKDGVWLLHGFTNQGDCVSTLQSKAGK